MTSPPRGSSFTHSHPDRALETPISTFSILSLTASRLSAKEFMSQRLLVITSKSLYEFKGTSTKGKEIKRVDISSVPVVLVSKDEPSRLYVACKDDSYRLYESSEQRGQIVSVIKEGAGKLGQVLVVVELTEAEIEAVLRLVKKLGKNSWIKALPSGGQVADYVQPESIGPSRKNSEVLEDGSEADTATPRTGGVKKKRSSSGEDLLGEDGLVGARGGLGAMTLIWTRLEHVVVRSMQDERTKLVVDKLQQNLKLEVPVFSKAGVPADSQRAMVAVSAVLMDSSACANLASLLGARQGPLLLSSIEANLGCGDALVRRWTAASMMFSLPLFEHANCVPNTPLWQQALMEYGTQSRRKENAVLKLLFPSAVGTGETSNVTSSRGSNLAQFKSVAMLQKSNDNSGGLSTRFARPPMLSNIGFKAKASTTDNSSMAMATNDTTSSSLVARTSSLRPDAAEDLAAMESSDRRLRGAFSLMWLSRLLDLESGDEDDFSTVEAKKQTSMRDLTRFTSGGIQKSDVQTLLQLLIGRYPDPNSNDDSTMSTSFEVETFGASVEFPELISATMSSLAVTRHESVRCLGLKQINVLVMRNVAAIRAFLAIDDWQSIILPCLFNVPFQQDRRTETQEDTHSYTLHLLITLNLAVLGSRSQASEFGPIDKLLGQTIYKIAVYSGWGESAISVVRSIFKGIFTSLAKQAQSAACVWRWNPSMDEWEELFRLSHLLQTFLFYRPTYMGVKAAPAMMVNATVNSAKRPAGGGFSASSAAAAAKGDFLDWRARVTHAPLLCRAQNDRMVAAHRQMYSKMALPVMTATHRGEDTGIHLNELGICADRSLAESATKLWNACGITGNIKTDAKKAEEYVSKSDRSRILYASNVCRELLEVIHMFSVVDEKRNKIFSPAVAASSTAAAHVSASPMVSKKKTTTAATPVAAAFLSVEEAQINIDQIDQVRAIARSKATDYLEKQKKKDANFGFLSKAKTKTAIDLRSNMLQKREVAIRKLGSGSEKVQAQLASTSTATESSGRAGAEGNSRAADTVLAIRGDEVMAPASSAHPSPKSYQVGPLGMVIGDEEKTVFEQSTPVQFEDERDERNGTVALTPRKTLVKLARKTGAPSTFASPSRPGSFIGNAPPATSKGGGNPSPHDSGGVSGILEDAVMNIPSEMVVSNPKSSANAADKKSSLIHSRKRSRPPLCHNCDSKIEEEMNEVSKFGHYWHSECVVCSNCLRNILTGSAENAGSGVAMLETCRFYPLSQLLLCSVNCRDEVLKRKGDSRCPACMDGFNKNEKTFLACGHAWHVDSQCFRCTSCDIRFDDTHPYFEYQGSPYCKKCLDEKFMRCKVCSLPLLDSDKVVEDSQGLQYHEACFACSVCHVQFGPDESFFLGKQGELLCFSHFLQKRSSPCALCHLPLNRKVETSVVEEDPVAMAGLTFHKSCFACSTCKRALNPSAKLGADDEANEHGGSLFCPDCYAEEFGLRCRACTKGIRGDVLHAGVGNMGETINWHPSCFVCDECHCSLVEVQFFLVSVGDDVLVPVCFDHYKLRYSNKTCPGCGNFVAPMALSSSLVISDSEQPPAEMLVENPRSASALEMGSSRTILSQAGSSASLKTLHNDRNPAIMYEDNMWHARCLVCQEPDCGICLYEEQGANLNKFRVETSEGKRYCESHVEDRLTKCHTCEHGIHEYEPRAGLMGWDFHETKECLACIKCKMPIEAGVALMKLEDGPAHQTCPDPPPRRKTAFGRFLERRKTTNVNANIT